MLSKLNKKGSVGEAIGLVFGILIVSVVIPVALNAAAGGNLSDGSKALIAIIDLVVIGGLVYAYIKGKFK